MPHIYGASKDIQLPISTELAVYYTNQNMEEDRRKNDPMETADQSQDAPPPHKISLGSASYGPRPLVEGGKEGMEEGEDDPDREEDDHETEEDRAARRKAKGKAKASSLPGDDHESDYDSEYPNPLRSHPTAAEDTDTDMDTYWAHEASLGQENAAGKESPSEIHFGHDADVSSSSSSFHSPNKENLNTPPGAPNNSPERHQVGWIDSRKLKRKLEEVQQQQRGGEYSGGRGRGRGLGWGLAWQETVTQQSAERQGWGSYDSPPPSPKLQKVVEETAWEEYDYSAWEKAAAEGAEKQRGGVLTLKVPHSPFSAKQVGAEGGTRLSIIPETAETVKESDPARQKVELVKATRSYQAIVRGTYLSYNEGDVMRVLHRFEDRKLIYIS